MITANLFAILGIGKAPLPIVLQAYFMAWGICGILANQLLLRSTQPSLLQILPSLGIAFLGGIAGSRLAAEITARLMPTDETLVVSRDSLIGLVGTVAFTITEEAGRILVYDEFGSLHDETCRVSPQHPSIEKGKKAIIVDRDTTGKLIVEEIGESAS